MNFDDLDAKMRVFETAHDHCVMPGINIVVRLDGRSFTKLTKVTLPAKTGYLKVPFDDRFHRAMVSTVEHLMAGTGLRVVYGFTESDEISLLLHRDCELFGRKDRKLNSVLAGEASAFLTLTLGVHAVFDSRICQLPTEQLVVDYFRWRQEDAGRNALSAHCFYALTCRQGDHDLPIFSAEQAHEATKGLSASTKQEILFERGINFNELPLWQKRGTGVFWGSVTKPGFNPHKGETTVATRQELIENSVLSRGDEYGEFVRGLLRESLESKDSDDAPK